MQRGFPYRFRNSSGSFAIFPAIRRASCRVSGFAFSFEHLAVRLENRQLLADGPRTHPI
jgi:hypothetical protein